MAAATRAPGGAEVTYLLDTHVVSDPRPVRDSLIAATAAVHGLVVVTRNERDFDGTGVRVMNPWVEAP